MIKLGVYYQSDNIIKIEELQKSLADLLIDDYDRQELSILLEERYTNTYTKNDYNIYYSELTIRNYEKHTESIIQILERVYHHLKCCNVSIICFFDTKKLGRNLEIYRRLFKIEMKLRLYCSRILIDTHNAILQTPHKIVDLCKPNKFQANLDNLKENYETDLFHIDFSQYPKLSTGFIKDIDQNKKEIHFIEFQKMIENATHDEFKKYIEILKNSVVQKEYTEALTSIEEILENSITDIRNCIAHHRFPSNSMVAKFADGEKGLKKLFEDVFEKEEQLIIANNIYVKSNISDKAIDITEEQKEYNFMRPKHQSMFEFSHQCECGANVAEDEWIECWRCGAQCCPECGGGLCLSCNHTHDKL